MKRAIACVSASNAATNAVVSASRHISSTSVVLQVQRPDLMYESHAANLTDLSRETFGSNPFSNYKPSAAPADLFHTPVDAGLGTGASDPYVRTLNNIGTTAESFSKRGEVSYGLTGPVSTVLSSALPSGAANTLVASTSAKRQLSVEEIASLEKGSYTLSEWIGIATQPTAADGIGATLGASSDKNKNNLLKVYIENFLKIEVPIPSSTVSKGYILNFAAKEIEEIALANQRPDAAMIGEQWKSIVKKFEVHSNKNATSIPKYILNPEAFLQQLEIVQREALLFVLSLLDGSGATSTTANAKKETEQLLAEVPQECALAVKALLSQSIEDRNRLIDTELVPIVTHSKAFDEGNAVWRALLQTFDRQKREIFVHAVLGGNTANAQEQLDLDMADTHQLAMFEWVMSHDRPLPRVTAPVALLLLFAAVRCTIGSPAAIAAAFDAAAAGSSTTSKAANTNDVVIDEAHRKHIPKTQTISRLSLVTDDVKANYLTSQLDKLLTFSTNNTASGQQKHPTSSKAGAMDDTSSTINPAVFIQQLRLAGFDIQLLQKIELQIVKANKQRETMAQRFKSVVGSEDATPPQQQSTGDKDGGTATNKTSNANTKHVAPINANTLTKAEKQQVAPLIALLQNVEGASALFNKFFEMVSKSSEEVTYAGRAFGFSKFDTLVNIFKTNKPEWWAQNYKTFAEVIVSDRRILENIIRAVKGQLEGSAKMAVGIISKEGKERLEARLQSLIAEDAENASRVNEIRKVLLARHNVNKAVECAAIAGADVSGLFRVQEVLERKIAGNANTNLNAVTIAAANDATLIEQLGKAIIDRHPQWEVAGVVPSNPADFHKALVAVAAHIFVRLSYIPHSTLALMKRNYRGRIGEVFLPNTTTNSSGSPSTTPQPRHHNVPVELGKVEHYDTNLYKRNDPQGWYQRMQDIHNRNVSVKVDLKDLRTVSDDYARQASSFGSIKPSKDGEGDDADLHGKKPYFGLQQERRLRVLAGDRVGMDIVKLDSDRYEDQPDNERYGVMKLQQLLSDAKKAELGEAYWPTVEVKVRNPSGQSKSMQSLIDFNRIEQQSKELFAQYREIKKKALFVSPTDLYLKDRSSDSAASGGSAKTSVTKEGYVVGSE